MSKTTPRCVSGPGVSRGGRYATFTRRASRVTLNARASGTTSQYRSRCVHKQHDGDASEASSVHVNRSPRRMNHAHAHSHAHTLHAPTTKRDRTHTHEHTHTQTFTKTVCHHIEWDTTETPSYSPKSSLVRIRCVLVSQSSPYAIRAPRCEDSAAASSPTPCTVTARPQRPRSFMTFLHLLQFGQETHAQVSAHPAHCANTSLL